MQQRIVFLDRASLQAQVRRPAFAHQWQEYAASDVGELPEKLRDATVAITNKVPLRAETLRQLPNLKMIAVAATGYDVIDIDYCKANGIAVSNIRNYAVHTVPEHAFALILALRRNLFAYREDVDNGRWRRSDQFCFFDHPIRDMHGATLGIIGEGALGQATAKIARGFGMNVLFADHAPPKMPGVEFTPYDEVLVDQRCDLAACPLTPETRNLIGIKATAQDEAQRHSHQYRARRAGRRSGAGRGARRGADRGRRLRRADRGAAEATAIRCSTCGCRILSSHRMSPGPATARCNSSPIS